MKAMQFKLNDRVVIANGAEIGVVVGRSEHINAANNYLVRYVAGDGRAVEQWWAEDALSPAHE